MREPLVEFFVEAVGDGREAQQGRRFIWPTLNHALKHLVPPGNDLQLLPADRKGARESVQDDRVTFERLMLR